jgi:hypothetical protein
VASPDGSSGSISNTVQSNAGEAVGKLHIEALHVLGTPALVQGKYTVKVNGQEVDQVEATPGVLKVSGLTLTVGQPVDISWQLGAASSAQ